MPVRGQPAGPTDRGVVDPDPSLRSRDRDRGRSRRQPLTGWRVGRLPVVPPEVGSRPATAAQRKRTGGSSPKTRQELSGIAKDKNLPGRSKMGREELARALGYK